MRAHTSSLDRQDDPRTQDLVPAVDHPDHPSRIDLPNERHRDMRKLGHATHWMRERGIGHEVGVQSRFLLRGRPFAERVDDMRDLLL